MNNNIDQTFGLITELSSVILCQMTHSYDNRTESFDKVFYTTDKKLKQTKFTTQKRNQKVRLHNDFGPT